MTDHTKGHTVAGVRAEIKAELTKLEVFEATIDPDDTPLLHNAVCAKIADLRAALEAKPEPDWEAWRPALERFYSHWDDCFVATPMDDEDKANVQGLIAFLAPPSQRGIGDEIEAIYADAGDIIAGIHEAISRVPVAGWPDAHDLVKEAFTAGAMMVYAEWKEVCECCPDPKHTGIPEAADQYWRDLPTDGEQQSVAAAMTDGGLA